MSDANEDKITGLSPVRAHKLWTGGKSPQLPVTHLTPEREGRGPPLLLSPLNHIFLQRGDGDVRMAARGWSNQYKERATSQGMQKASGSQNRRKHSPPEPPEGTTPATPRHQPSETDFRLWTSQSVRINTGYGVPPHLWSSVTVAVKANTEFDFSKATDLTLARNLSRSHRSWCS